MSIYQVNASAVIVVAPLGHKRLNHEAHLDAFTGHGVFSGSVPPASQPVFSGDRAPTIPAVKTAELLGNPQNVLAGNAKFEGNFRMSKAGL